MAKLPTSLALVCFIAPSALAQLSITEFVADNDGAHLDEDGDASDWIEICNTGAAPVSTAGHFLTDDADDLTKWALPDVEIPPLGYLVVFASAKDRSIAGSELHTNFSLRSGGEYLALVAPDGTTPLTEFAPEYPNQFWGTAYGSGTNGVITDETLVPWPSAATWFSPVADIGSDWQLRTFDDSSWTPAQTGIGFGYDEDDYPGYIGAGGNTRSVMWRARPGMYVRVPFTIDDPNEVVSMTLGLHFEDGLVAYLNGQQILSQSAPDSPAWNATSNDTLNNEVDELDPMKEFAVDFAGKLLAGENILAFHVLNNSQNSSDILLVPELKAEMRDLSAGLLFGYLESPTPGAPNNSVEFVDYVRDTTFDIDRGFFDAPFDLTVGCATPGATIIYTTDGSTPSPTNGTQIPAADDATPPSAVINIATSTPVRATAFKVGLRPANVDTQTYIFLDDVLDQPAQPPGYPLPWRQRNGNTIPGDFEMDPQVVGTIYTREELKEALRDLPTISIVTDIPNLFDQQTGIQVNPQDAGEASERPVSVELIDFEDGAPTQLDAGMRMNGNASRSTNRGKHNFRLAFRNEYGAGRLNFPLFGAEAPTETFNQIIVRGGNGNSWVHPSASVRQFAMYTRDQWFRDAHTAMGYPEALQREVHVYFNGLYFGMHHLFERIEEEWTAERFGGADEDWEGFRVVGGNNIEVIAGTPAEEAARMLASWQATLDAAEAGDLAGVQQYLDLDAYIDYILLNFHAGNADWDQNNVRAMRRVNPPGKYMFFCHDAERAGFNALSGGSLTVNVSTKNTARAPTSIHFDLRNHANTRDDYEILFADRAYKHLFNGGALTPENGEAQWLARTNRIRNAMKAESAKWGDHQDSTPRTLVDFDNGVNREINTWFPGRTPITISQLRATNVYPDIDPPQFNQHGGGVPVGFGLQMTTAQSGDVIYTLDGSDPREPGGAANPLATTINEADLPTTNVPINNTVTVKARLFDGVEWSALAEATFITGVPASSTNTKITELYYNPPGPSEDTEYLEITNISDDIVSLAGVHFTAGLTFAFPDIATLAPGARLLLVSDPVAFEAAFGAGHPVAGSYSGRLDNGGELITLSAANDDIIASFRYLDEAPWAGSPDGDGFSLVLVAPEAPTDYGDPASWRPSLDLGGTPGGSDSTAFAGATPEELSTYALGPGGGLEVSIESLSVNGTIDQYLVATVTRNLTADDVEFDVQFSQALGTWDGGDATLLGTPMTTGSSTTRAWRAPVPITTVGAPNFARLVLTVR